MSEDISNETDVFLKCHDDPQWESENIPLKKQKNTRPLRGPQAEMIIKIEKFIDSHQGGAMTVQTSRQTAKNEISAILNRRHLWRNQFSNYESIWVRTAPTHKPQIVNSKKRLEFMLQLDHRKIIHYPLFGKQKLQQREGYIWKLGNASVEFYSSGKHSSVVGGTASECLDMDEAHKIDKEKFDEDFAPFTANTNAGTLLWGVAANELDTLHWYLEKNKEDKSKHLNLCYPCEIWMEVWPPYASHVEDRVSKLGYDHPIIKTQYRLIPVSATGRYLQPNHIRALFSGNHERQLKPRPGRNYEALVDIAAGNEDFNLENVLEGKEDTTTDSTIIWIYEVTNEIATNGLFPKINIVHLIWLTGVDLPTCEEEIKETLIYWNIKKVTIDAIGVGRQIAESMESIFGKTNVNKYSANENSVSEDCFDLLARLNFESVRIFRDDGSLEWAQFEKQCGWTKYASVNGKMKLEKPNSKKHIDMVKALTYINQNSPIAGMHELYSVEGDYSYD